ncbi:unnamed protein product [Hydatigera taeniaeformis]|uniref:G_PROTEIN_RECEP_F3_4 domain-containing protein n=1 Tax=Hydatigena taeniaeformis TaxID=6205 RepID=A0A0R3WMY0_HYDTA|nr:unnamed protein product [Hydatigera taeniaeformis]
MLIIEPPDTELRFSKDLIRARLCCNTSQRGTIIPLAFPILLIAMCTIYAIKTRNLPQNFNEAKFIGFTMYTTCVLWLSIIPVYLSGYKTEVTLTLCISISATIALLVLFMPKTYIILCRPEKNSRMSFTTAKDIRCHIGVLQTNVNKKDKPKKKLFGKKSKPLVGRKSSGYTEVMEMASDRKTSSSPLSQPPEVHFKASPDLTAPSTEVSSPRIMENSPNLKFDDDTGRDSSDSVQVPLDENRQRKSFIRRERRLFPPQSRQSILDGKNAKLPMLMNSQMEEIRVYREQLKRLRDIFVRTNKAMQESENARYRAEEELQHLRSLAFEQNLPEREELISALQNLRTEYESVERDKVVSFQILYRF